MVHCFVLHKTHLEFNRNHVSSMSCLPVRGYFFSFFLFFIFLIAHPSLSNSFCPPFHICPSFSVSCCTSCSRKRRKLNENAASRFVVALFRSCFHFVLINGTFFPIDFSSLLSPCLFAFSLSGDTFHLTLHPETVCLSLRLRVWPPCKSFVELFLVFTEPSLPVKWSLVPKVCVCVTCMCMCMCMRMKMFLPSLVDPPKPNCVSVSSITMKVTREKRIQ